MVIKCVRKYTDRERERRTERNNFVDALLQNSIQQRTCGIHQRFKARRLHAQYFEKGVSRCNTMDANFARKINIEGDVN